MARCSQCGSPMNEDEVLECMKYLGNGRRLCSTHLAQIMGWL